MFMYLPANLGMLSPMLAGMMHFRGNYENSKRIYSIYSRNDEKQTFIDYARKAKGILKLNDQEANALIKHHKRKIAMAIKEGQKK